MKENKTNKKPKTDKNRPGAVNSRAIKLPSVRPGMPIDYVAPSKTDILGSWTGVPADLSVPEQDADDL